MESEEAIRGQRCKKAIMGQVLFLANRHALPYNC